MGSRKVVGETNNLFSQDLLGRVFGGRQVAREELGHLVVDSEVGLDRLTKDGGASHGAEGRRALKVETKNLNPCMSDLAEMLDSCVRRRQALAWTHHKLPTHAHPHEQV